MMTHDAFPHITVDAIKYFNASELSDDSEFRVFKQDIFTLFHNPKYQEWYAKYDRIAHRHLWLLYRNFYTNDNTFTLDDMKTFVELCRNCLIYIRKEIKVKAIDNRKTELSKDFENVTE